MHYSKSCPPPPLSLIWLNRCGFQSKDTCNRWEQSKARHMGKTEALCLQFICVDGKNMTNHRVWPRDGDIAQSEVGEEADKQTSFHEALSGLVSKSNETHFAQWGNIISPECVTPTSLFNKACMSRRIPGLQHLIRKCTVTCNKGWEQVQGSNYMEFNPLLNQSVS